MRSFTMMEFCNFKKYLLSISFSKLTFSRNIGVELVGKKRRELTGMVLNYFYAIGEAVIALIAWLAKDWVLLQLIVSAPPFLFISYYWYV